jgi:hypothetical protein
VTAVANPALNAFVAQLGEELLLAQVVIRRAGCVYELRHEADGRRGVAELRTVPVSELRALALHTAGGAFRPLKSAPNLQTGWRAVAQNDEELESALHQLYPGAVADWFAAKQQPAPVTHYREFTGRQTGMYRVTTMLTDEQAAQVTRACCHHRFCLKRRLWTIGALGPDAAGEKSSIPCLEPCAILLEFARKALRMEQENQATGTVAADDPEALQTALETALETALKATTATEREADFDSPRNPRRLQLEIEKLKSSSPQPGPDDESRERRPG